MENIVGNFFLIGLMGAGKTTLGKELAKALNRPFMIVIMLFVSALVSPYLPF